MSTAMRHLAVLPGALLGGPPLALAIALGLARHHHRTRKHVIR